MNMAEPKDMVVETEGLECTTSNSKTQICEIVEQSQPKSIVQIDIRTTNELQSEASCSNSDLQHCHDVPEGCIPSNEIINEHHNPGKHLFSAEFDCANDSTQNNGHFSPTAKHISQKCIDHTEVPILLDKREYSSTESLSHSDTFLHENTSEIENCDIKKIGNSEKKNPNASMNYSDSDSLSDFDFDPEYCKPSISQKKHTRKVRKSHNDENSDSDVRYYEVQLEILENSNRKLLNELSVVKETLSVQEAEFKRNHDQAKAEFEIKIDKFAKLCQTLKKDKETMVIRYANSEKEVIMSKKTLSELEKKIKDLNKDRENLNSKVRNLQQDKAQLSSTIDQKNGEFSYFQRDHEKLKEEITCKDIKIKWIQTKLKTEMDSHKETRNKLEHTMQRIQEMREEAEQVRRDCQEMIQRYQDAEEIKSVKLDTQLKEKLSELEVQKQERSDQEEVYQLLRHELEALKRKQRLTIEENNSLTVKIHSLEKERLEYEQTLSKLKDNQNFLKQEIVDLTARLAEMENLSMLLEREKEKVSASSREIERLRQTNSELQSDMDSCHMKEGELLEFTERLTDKTVKLQSEHSLLEAKSQMLEEEILQCQKQLLEMEQTGADLITALNAEKKIRQEETQILARRLAEKTKIVEQLNMKLEESDNENKVMKRRHITSIKELSRELQQCRKKIETFEAISLVPGETLSLGSRASSSASLDTIATVSTQNVTAVTTSGSQISPAVVFSGSKNISACQNSSQVTVNTEVNKQLLIERIVKLQKVLAKKNDKIEFLEDHITQLVKEMKKKSKIIQHYILKTEPGALIPNSSDMNKIDLAKRGGIMASLYRSQLTDSNMTIDLSLEINNKLQAVLEDTLLKNITLKENINTLGEEIARLTTERKELTRQICKNKSFKSM